MYNEVPKLEVGVAGVVPGKIKLIVLGRGQRGSGCWCPNFSASLMPISFNSQRDPCSLAVSIGVCQDEKSTRKHFTSFTQLALSQCNCVRSRGMQVLPRHREALSTQILTMVARFSALPWFPQKGKGSGIPWDHHQSRRYKYFIHHQQEKVFPVSYYLSRRKKKKTFLFSRS